MQRLLLQIDQRLHEFHHAIVVVSREFMKFSWTRKELDGLATRSKVLAILSDIGEIEVAGHSPRLAVAAFLGFQSKRLVRLIRLVDEMKWK